MMVNYKKGQKWYHGKNGTLVQRTLSGRNVFTSLITPLYSDNERQSIARRKYKVLIGSWAGLSERDKQSWRDVISDPYYPSSDVMVFPRTPNNLYYQINSMRQLMGVNWVRKAPVCGYNDEILFPSIRNELLPDQIVVIVDKIGAIFTDYCQIWGGYSDNYRTAKIDKELTSMGVYRIRAMTEINLTALFIKYFGELVSNKRYLVIVAQGWDESRMDRGRYSQTWARIV